MLSEHFPSQIEKLLKLLTDDRSIFKLAKHERAASAVSNLEQQWKLSSASFTKCITQDIWT